MSGHTQQSRQRQSRSRRSPYAKPDLGEAEVRRMLDARADGVSDADIASRFGVSRETIRRLIGRKGESIEVFCAR